MEDEYRTIEKPAEGIYREKGSRFLAFGFPVSSEEGAKQIIISLRKQYHGARHYCYAYRLGLQGDIFRVNDDGEPDGTGGKPIYHVLVAEELFNLLVVVVRYFGGTLLGRSNLARAYKLAATDMISNAVIITNCVTVPYHIAFPYDQLNEVMKILKEEGVSTENVIIENTCSIIANVRNHHSDSILKRISGVKDLIIKSVENHSFKQ